MKEQLHSILQIIEIHFKCHVWHTSPPISQIDYNLLLTAIEIIKIRDNISNIENINVSIRNLLIFMDNLFKIPKEKNLLKDWLKENKVQREVILKVYNQLSDLCSL